MTTHDAEDDARLAELIDRAAEIADGPDDDWQPDTLALVRDILGSRRADGSWVPAELIQEALRATLDLLDGRMRGLEGTDRQADRWLDACRRCADHLPTLVQLLEHLRSDLGEPDVPMLYVRAELEHLDTGPLEP